MMRLLLAAALCLILNSESSAQDSAAETKTLFVRRISPLLREKCLACHGNDETLREGGLNMASADGLRRGGDSGEAAVVEGRPEASPLYLAVLRDHDQWSAMPPKEAERLTSEQTEWIRRWIAGGAVWPDDEEAEAIRKSHAEQWSAEDGVLVSTRGGLSAEWSHRRYRPEDVWAYQPVHRPQVSSTQQHPIDSLLSQRMPKGLQLAPAADRRTLIRRAAFDLTGLPPDEEQIESFVNDPRSDDAAFSELVDQLLHSPHYGERMAQHWLDVVRYADTSGFANDYERGSAWRYRDYVVRSFNDDKPYDQFVREQLAGDELDSDNPEYLVATGFLRMGPWELTGMEVARIARQRFLDDVTNSVGETFLAHSLQCARCHDHKFDPVSTGDYYSIQAVFATTQLAERDAPFLPQENTDGFEEQRFLELRQQEYLQVLEQLDDRLLKSAETWFTENNVDPTEWNEAVARAIQKEGAGRRGGRTGVFNSARSTLMQKGVPEDQFPPKLYGFSPQDFGNERVARKGLERLRWELDRYQPYALAVYNGLTVDVKSVAAPVRIPTDRMTAGELESTCVLIGGDPFSAGPAVSPGVLSVLDGIQSTAIPEQIEGRRSVFAGWVTSPQNPLTTRAIVNRLWLWHFNQPLAGNPNNFGATGRKPTHPELLDWLASELVEQRWSIKAMHRILMTSDAYRRSTRHPDPAALRELDPLNAGYAGFKPRRLSAEELRDAMLAASGELNREIGGIPNRPEINMETALQPRQVMGTFAAAWVPNPLPSQRHRRTLYALKVRGLRDPFLDVFNVPSPDFSCEQRDTSTVTPQVFSLFNSQDSYQRALALANLAVNRTTTDEAALDLCFRRLYGRQPDTDERTLCMQHWHDAKMFHAKADFAVRQPPTEILREAVEENTGENFVFRELLYSNQQFVPDLQYADADAHTRALADICLAMINSNEFVYVY